MDRPEIFWPCRIFFEAGKARTGLVVLMLQASLIGWPLAVRMARRFMKPREVTAMLDAFSRRYAQRQNLPMKAFRARKAA
jgi:hypothetical protein